MPLSILNGPATFQRYINLVFWEYLDLLFIAYWDDILIYLVDTIIHTEDVRKVFKWSLKYGLFIKLENLYSVYQKSVF